MQRPHVAEPRAHIPLSDIHWLRCKLGRVKAPPWQKPEETATPASMHCRCLLVSMGGPLGKLLVAAILFPQSPSSILETAMQKKFRWSRSTANYQTPPRIIQHNNATYTHTRLLPQISPLLPVSSNDLDQTRPYGIKHGLAKAHLS